MTIGFKKFARIGLYKDSYYHWIEKINVCWSLEGLLLPLDKKNQCVLVFRRTLKTIGLKKSMCVGL